MNLFKKKEKEIGYCHDQKDNHKEHPILSSQEAKEMFLKYREEQNPKEIASMLRFSEETFKDIMDKINHCFRQGFIRFANDQHCGEIPQTVINKLKELGYIIERIELPNEKNSFIGSMIIIWDMGSYRNSTEFRVFKDHQEHKKQGNVISIDVLIKALQSLK